MNRMDMAVDVAREYVRLFRRGDVVLAGVARRTLDDLVGHPTGHGRVEYPALIEAILDEVDHRHLVDEAALAAELAGDAAGDADPAARLRRAAKKINAVSVGDARWAHRDDGTQRWYIVTDEELSSLCDYLDASEQICADAYSHWCAGTLAEEMPADWNPIERVAEVRS
jgi:hypothetical protein